MKITKRHFLALAFVFFVFQSPIAMATQGLPRTIVNNFDELIVLLILAYVLLEGAINNAQRNLMAFLFVFLATGLIGTIRLNLQPLSAVVQDALSCSKYIIALIGGIAFFRKSDAKKFFVLLQNMVMIIVPICFVLAVVDQVIRLPFLQHSAKRFGRYALQLFYYHPALVAQMMIMFLAILYFPGKNSKFVRTCQIMCLVMLCLTFRTKAIAFAFVYVFLGIYDKIKDNKVYRIAIGAVMIIAVIFLSADSFEKYYGSMENTARGKLTLGGITLAERYLPFGAGFATYGTAAAASHYSPFYYEFGFDSVYGLGYVNTNYATDTFWPGLMAEFGVLGGVVYCLLLVYVAFMGIDMLKRNTPYRLIYWTLFLYLIVCTTSGTGFFNPIAMPYGILMGICIAENKKEIKTLL